MPNRFELSSLSYYRQYNYELIPLIKKGCLVPGWPHKDFPDEYIDNHLRLKQNANIGVRLAADDLVLDADPRHGSERGLRKLGELIGGEPSLFFPTVNSGGGGTHYYLKKPPGVKYKPTQPLFEGVDFKSVGTLVVAAGSVHPDTGNYYEWDDLSPTDEPAPLIPEALAEVLTLKTDRPVSEAGDFTLAPKGHPDELEVFLYALDPCLYRNYDDWRDLLFACHAFTNGEGLGHFVEWSTSDPAHSHAKDSIITKWNSATSEGGITGASLFRAFRDLPEEEQVEAFRLTVDRMSPDDTIRAIPRLVRRMGWFPRDSIVPVLKSIAHNTHQSMTELRKRFASARVEHREDQKEFREAHKEKAAELKKKDYKKIIAEAVYKEALDTNRPMISAVNQQFYQYNGKFWESVAPNELDLIVERKAEELHNKYYKVSDVYKPAAQLLRALAAEHAQDIRFDERPPSVINTLSGEIWINESTGTHELLPHRPDSYLHSIVEIDYDPAATCPLFDATLREIFSLAEDAPDLIRHLWELFGYVIQNRKNIPSWWLFYGPGSNGKSLVLVVLMALLNERNALSRSVHEFANTNFNNHALANLVSKLLLVDDDLDCTKKLPEGGLKKLSEEKLLEANPKGLPAFNFHHTAAIILASNNWPRVSDVSHGFMRRVQILPFDRVFAEYEQDIERSKVVIDSELSGVFNLALAGLKRLRARGKFDPPLDSRNALNEWRARANPIIAYFHENTTSNEHANTPTGDVFDAYMQWALTNESGNHRRATISPSRFIEMAAQLGYKTAIHDEERVFCNLSIVPPTPTGLDYD